MSITAPGAEPLVAAGDGTASAAQTPEHGRVAGQGLVEYGLIAAIAVAVAILALAVFDDQVAFVLSIIGNAIDRAT